MATYVNDLRLKEISTGDESGTWGTSTNTNLELIGEALGYATEQSFGSDADATTTVADGVSDPARAMYFKVTSAGNLTATRTLTIAPNTVSRVMFIENATSGSQSIAISQGSGANVTIATGKTAIVYLDGAGSGAAVVDAMAGVDPGVTDTLAEVLTAGNTTGGTSMVISSGDDVTFTGASANIVFDSSDSALEFADNAKAIFGAGSDLQIYHDGLNSYIVDAGTGDLYFRSASNLYIGNAAGTQSYITATDGGAVDLRYNGSAKLATTNTGIDVTGTVVSDGLTVDGNAVINNGTNATLQLQATGGNAYQLRTDVNDVFIYNATGARPLAKFAFGGDVSFYEDTGTTPKMFWDASTERLGIGTTSPASLLTIQDATPVFEIDSTTSSNTATIQFTSSGTVDSKITHVGNTGVMTIDSGRNSSWGGKIAFVTDTVERMRIDNSGNVTVQAAGELRIRDDGTFIKEDQGLQIGNTSGTGTTRPIRFFTESAERMRIDSSGHIGINVTSSLDQKINMSDTADVGIKMTKTGSITTTVRAVGGALAFGVDGSAGTTERMRIDSSGRLGIGTSSPSNKLHVTSASTGNIASFFEASTGNTNRLYIGANSGLSYIDATAGVGSTALGFKVASTERMRIDSSGHITSLPTYNNGSASSANMVVNSSGLFLRSVSSAKYKTNIEDVQDAYVDSLLNIRPVYYRSTLENDNTEHSHWGFIAEEVAEIDPRLVHYKTVDISYSDDGERVETELETPEPEGVQYDRFAPLMLKLIQKQQATITALEARITQLENN
jgi:hypothetical protein